MNLQNEFGYSALHFAADNNHSDVVATLASRGTCILGMD